MAQEQKSRAPHCVIAFHEWMISEEWHKHSDGTYIKGGEWPPEDSCTKDELLIKFFGM